MHSHQVAQPPRGFSLGGVLSVKEPPRNPPSTQTGSFPHGHGSSDGESPQPPAGAGGAAAGAAGVPGLAPTGGSTGGAGAAVAGDAVPTAASAMPAGPTST